MWCLGVLLTFLGFVRALSCRLSDLRETDPPLQLGIHCILFLALFINLKRFLVFVFTVHFADFVGIRILLGLIENSARISYHIHPNLLHNFIWS